MFLNELYIVGRNPKKYPVFKVAGVMSWNRCTCVQKQNHTKELPLLLVPSRQVLFTSLNFAHNSPANEATAMTKLNPVSCVYNPTRVVITWDKVTSVRSQKSFADGRNDRQRFDA